MLNIFRKKENKDKSEKNLIKDNIVLNEVTNPKSQINDENYAFQGEKYKNIADDNHYNKTKKKTVIIISFIVVALILGTILVFVNFYNPDKYKKDEISTTNPVKGAPVINIENRPNASNNYTVKEGALSVPEIALSTGNGIVNIIQYKKNEAASAAYKCSGVIISQDGYIVTSAYLLSKSDGINVILANGSSYQGFIVGIDNLSDLAVIKINETNLYVPTFGDSANLNQGEDVVSIGANSESNNKIFLSKGVASAIIEDKATQGGIAVSCIETDAVVCQENSGGALTNIQGQIIGILSSRLTDVKTANFGYAISIAGAKGIISDLVNFGYVKNRARLGVTTKEVDDVMIKVYGVKKGLYVSDVDTGSDAYSAGVEKGNIIVAANGTEVSTNSDLSKILYKYKPGDKISLTVEKFNSDGTSSSVVVRVALMEDIPS